MLSYQLNILSYHIYTIHIRTIIFFIYSYSILLSKCKNSSTLFSYLSLIRLAVIQLRSMTTYAKKTSYILNKTQMKPKIVGDRTSPDSIPTRDDKHKYFKEHKMSGIEHPQTQYQHVMININITKNIKCRGSNIPKLNTNMS